MMGVNTLALPSTIVPVHIEGLDTKNDAKQLIPGKLASLQNGVFTTPGKIRKRNGAGFYNNQTNSSSPFPTAIPASNVATTYNNELLMGDGQQLWSYSPALGEWTNKGSCCAAKVTSSILYHTELGTGLGEFIGPQVALNATVKMVSWFNTALDNVQLQVLDLVTGNVLVNQVVTGSSKPGIPINAGGTLTFFYNIGTALNAITWNGTGLSYTYNILTLYSAAATFDVVTDGTNYLLTAADGAGAHIYTYLITPTFTIPAYAGVSDSVVGMTNQVATYFDSVNSYVWVTYYSGSTLYLHAVNAACTAPTVAIQSVTVSGTINGASVIQIAGAGASAIVFYSIAGTPDANGYYLDQVTSYAEYTGGVFGGVTAVFSRAVGVASKPWNVSYNGTVFPAILTYHDSGTQAVYFAMGFFNNTRVVLAKACSYLGAGGALLSAPSVVSGVVHLGALQNYEISNTTVGSIVTVHNLSGPIELILDFTATNPNTVILNNNLLLGGGYIYGYDGLNLNEQNFHLFPENMTATPSASGGHLLAGVYGYQVTYEWTDNQGQVHQSQPSNVVSVPTTGAGTSSVSLSVPYLRITDKTNVQVVLWRTVQNGSVYYRLTTLGAINNTTGSDYVTYSDTAADTSINGNKQLYTTGEVPNFPPPPSYVMANAQNRTILVPSEQPTTWWYSKENPAGSPPEFSDSFVNNVDPTGGAVTAVAQMDSNLLLLKNTSIYYVSGTGPANSGAGSTYSDATLLPTASGSTTNQVVVTPQGLMYQSKYGIWLLSRSLSDSYIGAPVEQFNSYPITSALLVPGTTQVRFQTNSNTAATLVYDYFVNQWSQFTGYWVGTSACLVQGIYTWIGVGGSSYYENVGNYTDIGSNYIALSLTTGWLSMAGLQGFQRVRKMYLLGTWRSSHNLTVQFAYDYANPSQTDTFAVSASVVPYQFRFFMNVQKCQAIQLTITDSLNGTAGEGFDLSGIAFEVGAKKGFTKNINPNQSFG
jgi:hypothetical protein